MSTRISNSSKIYPKLLVFLILALACLTIFVANTGTATAEMVNGPLTKLDVKLVVNKVAAKDGDGSCIDGPGLWCGNADFYPIYFIDGVEESLLPVEKKFEDEDVIFPGEDWSMEGRADFGTNFCHKVKADSGLLKDKGGCTEIELLIKDQDWNYLSDDDLIDINDLSGDDKKKLRFKVHWNNEFTDFSNITNSFGVEFQGCDLEEFDDEISGSGSFLRPMEYTNSDDPTAAPTFKSPEFRCIGNEDDRAGIRLHIEVAMTGDPLYEPSKVWRNLVLPDQIFPDPSSTFKIRSAVVGPIGNARDFNDDNVVMTTEMYVSEPDGDSMGEVHTVCLTEGADKTGYTDIPYKDFTSLPNAWVLNELENGSYTIQQKRDGRFLDAWGGNEDKDYNVVTRIAQDNGTQEWILKPLGDSSYTIQQKVNGRFLDAHGNAVEDFSAFTRTAQNNDSQRWVVTPLDDGSATIQQVESGRFLDAYESEDHDWNVVTREKDYNGLVCEIEVGPFEGNPESISFGAVSYDANGRRIDASEPRTISFDNKDWDFEEGPMAINIGRDPEQSMDIIFAPEMSDFSPPCEITGDTDSFFLDEIIIPLIKKESEIPDDIMSQIEVGWGFIGTHDIDCSMQALFTYDPSLLREEIQLTLENSFFAAQQWEGMAYSDVLMKHRDQLNFWYTEKPVHVAGTKMFHVLDDTWANGPSDSTTAMGHGFGDVVFVVRKTDLRATAHPIHRTVSHPVRDADGQPIWDRFLTINHELGHNPFGLTDLYDTTCNEVRTFNSAVDDEETPTVNESEVEDNSEVLKKAQTPPGCTQTLYYQRNQLPNVYANMDDWTNWYEVLGYFGIGFENLGIAEVVLNQWDNKDSVPGCIFRDSALKSEGLPMPPGLEEIWSDANTHLFTGCDEIDNSDDPVAAAMGNEPPDWWRAEPLESAMGNHRHSSDWLPAYRKWQSQALGLPVTPQRDNAWQYGPASAERITFLFEELCPDDC